MFLTFDEAGELVRDLTPQREFERTSGLPWHRTVAELQSAYGVEQWRDFVEVIPLRGVRALGFDGEVKFRHRLFAPRRLAPAYDFQAELNAYGDHLRNHAWALDHLTKLFVRAPRLDDVSNCLAARWDFGLIEVSVLTFLPSKQRYGTNALYERHPDLWHVANLTVESRLCAYREPVELDLRDGLNLQGVSMGSGDFVTNRLLVRGARHGLRVWRDRESGRVGVANPWGTIIRPLGTESRLVLHERTPARGGGSASLELDGVELLQTTSWNGLREAADRVARFFKVVLERDSYPDE